MSIDLYWYTYIFWCLSIRSESDLWWQLLILLCKCNWSLIWKKVVKTNDRLCALPPLPLKEGGFWPTARGLPDKQLILHPSNVTEAWKRMSKGSSNSTSTTGGESFCCVRSCLTQGCCLLCFTAHFCLPSSSKSLSPQDEPNSNSDFCRASPSQS